jgi:two-component system, chemotaxis family, protein-glutamate methylesterase/glutaminase
VSLAGATAPTRVRVLIVDDSLVVRRLLAAALERDGRIEVVGSAPDAFVAREMIERLRPDVLMLDIEMPGMDGLTFLEQLMRVHPMPVIMVSSFTGEGCEMTLRALELGAVDFVPKARLRAVPGMPDGITDLALKVTVAAGARPRTSSGLRPRAASAPGVKPGRLLAVGASTGGTEAIRMLLAEIPPDGPPVVVVQHMPPRYTRAFAERCDRDCAIRVTEAADGDAVVPGHALIAPGGQHMTVARKGARVIVQMNADELVNGVRPSVDVLFHSVAETIGAGSVGILLTGMGTDGARGLLAMQGAGARTIAQDEATSVIFGMPKAAIGLGAADHVLALPCIGTKALELAGS